MGFNRLRYIRINDTVLRYVIGPGRVDPVGLMHQPQPQLAFEYCRVVRLPCSQAMLFSVTMPLNGQSTLVGSVRDR